MFVDASAIVAIVLGEPEAAELSRRYLEADVRLTSAIAVYEAALAIARAEQGDVARSRALLDRLLTRTGVRLVQIGSEETKLAVEAYARFGKGRHPARLNMGDCFAYACARSHGAPLLYKGCDFALTDIEAA